MKKYIRRANGVYELKINEQAKKENVSNYFYTFDNDYKFNLLFEKKDLKQFKQADTIEELCDEFVQETDCFGNKPIVIKSNTLSAVISIAKEYTVYGAIWTNKGLIYVAKMNDKGELELL